MQDVNNQTLTPDLERTSPPLPTDNYPGPSGQVPTGNLANQVPTGNLGFIKRNFKVIIVIFAVILVVESIWAFNFVSTVKKQSPIASVQDQLTQSITPLASLSLDPPQVITPLNQQFTLNVIIDSGGRQINGADAVIQYDPQILIVVDSQDNFPGIQVASGDIYPSLIVNSVDPVAGRIVLTGARLAKDVAPFSGQGILATITFTPQVAQVTEVTLVNDKTIARTSLVTQAQDSANILTHVNNATITISQ